MNRLTKFIIAIFLLSSFMFFSCADSNPQNKIIKDSDIIAKAMTLKGYDIRFVSNHTYIIVQIPAASCYGEGTWNIENNKINLSANDSRCETGQNLEGTYSYSDFQFQYKD